LKLKLITVGKLKESFLKNGVDFYSKKIKKHIDLEIIEIQDEKAPESRSLKEEEKIKFVEGEKIISKIKDEDYVITLEINGKKLDSDQFKKLLLGDSGERKSIAIIIGGSVGLSREVSKRSDYKLSFSDMTFPHQLMKLVILEQINRAF
jgi:23S rRNA (pseudouridine1915-N3)-methyltransferase